MRYFYYVRRSGKLYPQASADHPTSRLVKPTNIVGKIHDLTAADLHLTLTELTKKYPEPSQ